MKKWGFIRVAAATPALRIADTEYNCSEICKMVEKAEKEGVSVLLFPELCITGYTCGDLFGQQLLLDAAEAAVKKVMEFTRGKSVTTIIGAPVRCKGRLYNCALVIRSGNIKGIVPKIWLPNYNEFYEARWFSSGKDFLNRHNMALGAAFVNGKDTYREGFCEEVRYAGFKVNISPNLLFETDDVTFGIEICEDMWTPIPPSCYHALAGAQLIFNPSASNEVLTKHEYRKTLVSQLSARNVCGYVYSSSGFGESTQDLAYGGAALIYENGTKLAESERFSMEPSMTIADIDIERLNIQRQKLSTFAAVTPDGTTTNEYTHLYLRVKTSHLAATDFESKLYRHVEPHPFVPEGDDDGRCKEILSIQVAGLASRLSHIGKPTAVIGISGGLDSTLALLVAVMAFDRLGRDREGIIGITMPGYGTTDHTHDNAVDLMRSLGITLREIPIAAACDQHFHDIGHDKSVHDVTYENSQARERTQILMDVANSTGGIVVGTGDLSELALGWATYNGDHMSMYAVNSSIPKTLVRHLVRWCADNYFGDGAVAGAGLDDQGVMRSPRSILYDIIDTPISPELLPSDEMGNITQRTEDLVGPYELHDFFLYNFFRNGYSPAKLLFLARKAFSGVYSEDVIKKWLKAFVSRFFSQQFKRSCLPDGPKVGTVSLSPRGDWRMPSDAKSSIFLRDIE